MNKSQNPPFLKNERQKTDDSLIAERHKTNVSLTKAKKTTELQTDKIVQDDRNKADSLATETRQAVDDHTFSDDRLLEERNRADDAVTLERTRVDLAIEKEREIKKALAISVLEHERNLTDKSLSAERTQTDSEVQRTTVLLHSEISEHEKTKTALTTRDEFLAIVSHDLRNPIGTAALCAEMLLQNPTFKNLGTEVTRSIELIKRNIDTSLRLIADLLDMERIVEGKLHLKLEKHDVGQIIHESIESFSNLAAEKDVTLSSTQHGLSSEITCDRDRILQVLSNLIGNALKFTPAGGSITVDTLFNQSETQVTVSDTGPGIPENKKDQIFQRFAQLGQNDRKGLGLGLYISKMLIEEHRGKLWLQSKLGEGSTFYFTIPI